MRGKPHCYSHRRTSSGNIPAYAGKTQGCSGGVDLHAEHPRIRGENGYAGFHRYRAAGTSPHTRGKRRFCNHAAGASRNIPAYAGKTRPPTVTCQSSEEHPRIRGENALVVDSIESAIGTSPHTRGKPRCAETCPLASRNIPAYAGKTSVIHSDTVSIPEHPRIRGENTSDQ